MGSWDVYCAICGGPFCGVQISRKRRSASFRRKYGQPKPEPEAKEGPPADGEKQSGEHHAPAAETEPNDEAATARNGDGESKPADDEDVRSLSEHEEDYSYDPQVITEMDTAWTQVLHVLGVESETSDPPMTFVSGPGQYDNYGSVDVMPGEFRGTPVNYLGEGSNGECNFTAYFRHGDDGSPVYPFHWPCWEILARKLHGAPVDTHKIRGRVLYDAWFEEDRTANLDVDYGQFDADEQFWISYRGQEHLVSNPGPAPALTEFVKARIASQDFRLPDKSAEIVGRQGVKDDPFRKLPYDILFKIATLLDLKSLLSVFKSSLVLHRALHQDDQFWKRAIRKRMVWLWEINDLLVEDAGNKLLDGKDLKGLFLYFEHMTRLRDWITGEWMSLANRRRIWCVCQQISEYYYDGLEGGGKVETHRGKLDSESCEEEHDPSLRNLNKTHG